MKSRHCEYGKFKLCNFCRHSNNCMSTKFKVWTTIGGDKVVIGYCEDI